MPDAVADQTAFDRHGTTRRKGHLSSGHPIADAARRNCVGHAMPPASRIGGVACGRCWEQAIRDDERAVVAFDLPRELEPDPDYVDPVAIERASAGDAVELSKAEKRATAVLLDRHGHSHAEIAYRLGITTKAVARFLDEADSNGDAEIGEAA